MQSGGRRAQQVDGAILTADGWVVGSVSFDERVLAIRGAPVSTPDASLPVVLPGFVDVHVHGGGGADVMDGDGAVDTVARLHARHGTTSLLATTLTAPLAELEAVLADAGTRIRRRVPGGARVLGVHLEGPFINPGKLGAQPPHARTGTLGEVSALNALAPIRIVTLAPELSGHLDLIRQLRDAGFIPQLGHTLGTY
jgi:N-acetylglucosamine-6-phosphate deacetylase